MRSMRLFLILGGLLDAGHTFFVVPLGSSDVGLFAVSRTDPAVQAF